MIRIVILSILLLLPSCVGVSNTSTEIYNGHSPNPPYDRVKIFVVGTPTVSENSFSIELKFESPTKDTHLIQQLHIGRRIMLESFRMTDKRLPIGQTDHHFVGKRETHSRRIVIIPGSVVDVDETSLGFAMLPSDWPYSFNKNYREGHQIQGRITKIAPEHATVYKLKFDKGVLTLEVEGTDIKQTWFSK